jgi:hypothetical protein
MSLRWRCAPACGSEVVPFRAAYPALIPQRVFFENRASGTDGARLCRAFGALSLDSPGERVRFRRFQTRYAAGMPRLYVHIIVIASAF